MLTHLYQCVICLLTMYYDEYAGLFSYGNTEQEVKEKACQVYLQTNIESIRKKYGKYSKGYLNR